MVQMMPDKRTREALVLMSSEQMWSKWVLAEDMVRFLVDVA